MTYIPYEKMTINWNRPQPNQEDSFSLHLPWVSMEYDVTQEDKDWILDATKHLHSNPLNTNVQRFIENLKDYPVAYQKPRRLKDFEGLDLQECRDENVDYSTPLRLIETFGCPIEPSLRQIIPERWLWIKR